MPTSELLGLLYDEDTTVEILQQFFADKQP